MAIHPDPRFPLLPKDQAEVIGIYLELMRAQDASGRQPEVVVKQPPTPRPGAGHAPIPPELQDLD